MKNIYLIVGPSGSGKSTVADQLNNIFGYKIVQSYTERPKRFNDETGHIFVTPSEFDKLGKLCAYTLFNGYRYGVPDNMIDNCDLYVIDPAGVEYMKKNYFGLKNIKVVGINCSESICANRMRMRGDSEQQINERINFDKEAFKNLNEICDIIIDNSDLEKTISYINNFIKESENN